MVLYNMSTMQNMSQSYQQFAGSTMGQEPFVVLVYADWCGHCRDFHPLWKEMLSDPSSPVNGVEVEESVFKHLTSAHPDNALAKIISGTRAYPNIITVTPELETSEYTGKRDRQSFASALQHHAASKPAAKKSAAPARKSPAPARKSPAPAKKSAASPAKKSPATPAKKPAAKKTH
jgi:thiol-disulfide isomerase/thioredoxin